MEKKVLLKDLVEFGSNVRRQFISKVRVSDEGLYPIGELWDANTTLDMIVNGAHEQHDTIRELDEFAHNTDNKLTAEIARAKNAEQQLEDKKANKSDVYTKAEIDAAITSLLNTITSMQEKIVELELKIEDIISGEIPVNSITTDHIVDGTIKMEDLSDEVTDKLLVTVDEHEENAHFGG